MDVRRPWKKRIYPYLFLAPFAIMTLLFFVIPAFATVWMGMTDLDRKMNPNFIGFENYAKILQDRNFWPIVKVTIIYVIVTLIFKVAFAVTLAVTTQYMVQHKHLGYLYRVIWLIPSTLPTMVYALFWKWFFNPSKDGTLNKFLMETFGLTYPVSWFNEGALGIVIVAAIVSGASGGMILLAAQINSIGEDVFKAARIDGAKERAIIRDIILPALRWPIMYVTLTGAISLFSSYHFIYLTTQGGPVYDTTTLSYYGFTLAFGQLRYGYGSAISFIVVIISIVLTLLLFKLFDFNKLIRPPRIED